MKLRTIIKETARDVEKYNKLFQLFVKELFRRKFDFSFSIYKQEEPDEDHYWYSGEEMSSVPEGVTIFKTDDNVKFLKIYFPDPLENHDTMYCSLDEGDDNEMTTKINAMATAYGVLGKCFDDVIIEFGYDFYHGEYSDGSDHTILKIRNENA